MLISNVATSFSSYLPAGAQAHIPNQVEGEFLNAIRKTTEQEHKTS